MHPHPFHTSNWPRSVAHVQDYPGGDRLHLDWDLGRVTEREKKATIQAWARKLPELQHLRWLSVWSHVTPPLFEAACTLRGLECLQLKWTNLQTLQPIEQLAELQSLFIGSSTKVASIEPLAALQKLKWLEIENFKLIADFQPLLALRSLESLAVTGSMWARQDVGSLEPFAQMTWLSSLAIDTAKVTSLRPLAALKNLKFLGLGGRLPMEEYAWLSARLPTTECRWFAPYLDLADSGIGLCRKCKQQTQVMLTGRRAGTVCRVCDHAKVQRHEEAFHAARAAAA